MYRFLNRVFLCRTRGYRIVEALVGVLTLLTIPVKHHQCLDAACRDPLDRQAESWWTPCSEFWNWREGAHIQTQAAAFLPTKQTSSIAFPAYQKVKGRPQDFFRVPRLVLIAIPNSDLPQAKDWKGFRWEFLGLRFPGQLRVASPIGTVLNPLQIRKR